MNKFFKYAFSLTSSHLPLIFLILIILLAVLTRLYKLGEVPAGFYVDEAGQGYSAYSLLLTGKDEFGKSLPVVFRSLTDFKTPVYIYLVIPVIKLFGLTAFSVRFPSFLFSILTIPVLYFLIKELLPVSLKKQSTVIGLISALFLAISPWHILFGRTNFECNVALFFYLAGVLSFYKSLKNPKMLILSALMFAIAIPAYHSQRINTPLTLIALFLRHRQVLLSKNNIKFFISGAVLAFIILLPTISVMRTPGFLARASGLNIFSHTRQMPDGYIKDYQGFAEPLINSSIYLSTREFFSLYFSYLSPRYMFILGDYGPRSSFPELSTFYLWQFPFYLLGLWRLLKQKNIGEFKFFLIMLLLISPIPAAVTRDPYTTIRALPMVIPQNIIIAFGLVYLFNNTRKKFIFLFVAAMLVTYSLFKLYSSVFLLNEFYRAKYWDYGWDKVTYSLQNLKPHLPVIVDNARFDAYPQLAFFLRYPPEAYQKENFEVPVSEYYTNMTHNPEVHLGNITTRRIDWQNDLTTDQYLVGDELAISPGQISEHKLTLVSEILYPDGTPAFRIVRTNPVYELEQKRLFFSGKNKEQR